MVLFQKSLPKVDLIATPYLGRLYGEYPRQKQKVRTIHLAPALHYGLDNLLCSPEELGGPGRSGRPDNHLDLSPDIPLWPVARDFCELVEVRLVSRP